MSGPAWRDHGVGPHLTTPAPWSWSGHALAAWSCSGAGISCR